MMAAGVIGALCGDACRADRAGRVAAGGRVHWSGGCQLSTPARRHFSHLWITSPQVSSVGALSHSQKQHHQIPPLVMPVAWLRFGGCGPRVRRG